MTHPVRLPSRARSASLTFAVVAAGAVAVGPVSSASAACVGRPGASAIEQYCEAVPQADGSRQSPGQKSNGSSLPESSKRTLDKSGAAGAAVAALAATGGGGSGGSGGSSGGSSSSGGKKGSDDSGASSGEAATAGVAAPAEHSGNPLSAAKQAVETGPTAGPTLAWSLFGLSALGVIGALFVRRSRLTVPPAAAADES